jgi:hypothetical protein
VRRTRGRKTSATEAAVQIEGRRVHQFGLLDRPRDGGPEVRYPSRVLLGWSDIELQCVAEHLTEALLTTA